MNNNTQLQTTGNDSIIHSLAINGDISKLNEKDQVTYYRYLCERIGLDPLTQPLKKITMNSKTTLYCDRSGIAQLTHLYEINHEVLSRVTTQEEIHIVTCRVTLKSGRTTESVGAVSLKGLSGEARANAYMKAETKAKRRGVLDLVGLGMLDETEIDTIKSDSYSNASTADELNKRRLNTAKKPEPIAELPEPVQSDPPPAMEISIDAHSLKKLNTLGSLIYGDKWDDKRPELVEKLTKGRTKSSKELTMAEALTLITGLEKEKAVIDQLPEITEALNMFSTEDEIQVLYERLAPELQKHAKVKALFTARNKEIGNGKL